MVRRAARLAASFRSPVLAMSAVLFLAGCASSAEPAHRNADTLVVVEQSDGATMNPLYAQGQMDGVIYQTLLFDPLTTIGPGFKPIPDLAVSWTPSAGGLEWDVDLRRGVRWSDGQPFTSSDVAFTYRIMRDPKTAYVNPGAFDALRDVRITGTYRVHFRLKYVTARFADEVLGVPMLPEHVLGSIPADRQLYSSFGERPVGTGPYVLREWQHDSATMFDRNPTYWGGPAKIAHVQFHIIFNAESGIDALESGSADLIDYLGYVGSLRLAREAPAIRQMQQPSLEVGVFEPNLRRPGLSDVRVRQAMMYAHDRVAIIHGFYGGEATIANSTVSPALVRWFDPAVKTYPYDPARARALLDAAGWKPGADGVRTKNGTRLSFDALVNQGSPLTLDQVLAFAADMQAVGIHINARLLDFPSIVDRSFRGDYDCIFDVRGGVVDPDPTYLFSSKQMPPAGGNTVGYVDPEADRLIDAGLRELSYPKRREIYDRLQEHLAQTLPMLWDVNDVSRMAFTARLHLDPHTTLAFPLVWTNVATWQLAP